MSTISDFNRIEDCDKIDPLCVDAYLDFSMGEEEDTTDLCVKSSWGGDCIDLTPIVKRAETLTTMYLSPDTNPNCLVYEPERGDNICIHGDDLSRIISMRYLKDVSQSTTPSDGSVYMYNGQTNLFEPYDLKTTVANINTAITNINAAITNLQNRMTSAENRLTAIEAKLTPPSDAPSGVSVVFGNINTYSDSNAAIDGSGVVTSLDKTHGLYTHLLANEVYGDEIFG